MLTALNIVSGKEVGTMEQINVSPIKTQFYFGKTHSFWILAMIAFTLGLLVSVCFTALKSKETASTSTFCSNLFVCGFRFWFADFHVQRNATTSNVYRIFLLMIFNLMRIVYACRKYANLGAEKMTNLNPLRQLIEVIRLIILKNAGFMNLFATIFLDFGNGCGF